VLTHYHLYNLLMLFFWVYTQKNSEKWNQEVIHKAKISRTSWGVLKCASGHKFKEVRWGWLLGSWRENRFSVSDAKVIPFCQNKLGETCQKVVFQFLCFWSTQLALSRLNENHVFLSNGWRALFNLSEISCYRTHNNPSPCTVRTQCHTALKEWRKGNCIATNF
jgi:hypothetical protein